MLGRGGRSCPENGLYDTEELRRNWPGREVAGEAVPGRGSECAKFSMCERASCVPGSEGSQTIKV